MTRHQIIIDTDPGVDDAVAILTALASPAIEVLGITAVAGNVPLEATLTNACRIVGLSGRRDVPVFAGAPGPLVRDQVFGKYAAIGAFPERMMNDQGVVPEAEHAVRFIVRRARMAAEAKTPITICAIGPLTNIALALHQHPDVARGIKQIVCMGGAFHVPAHGVPWAEFNIRADPHAAQIVFGSGVPVVLMPLDVTTQALFTKADIAHFRGACGVPGRAVANLLTEYDRSDMARYGRPGGPLHDPMTIAWLLAPDLFTGAPARVLVQTAGATSGQTIADFTDQQAPITVMSDVDEAGYIALLSDLLATYAAAPERAVQERT